MACRETRTFNTQQNSRNAGKLLTVLFQVCVEPDVCVRNQQLLHKVMFRVQLCSALTKSSNFLPTVLHTFADHVLNYYFHFRMLVAILFSFACASGAAICMTSLVSLLLYVITLYHLSRYTPFVSVSFTLSWHYFYLEIICDSLQMLTLSVQLQIVILSIFSALCM